MLIKETDINTRQPSWFAVEDINRRAAAAYLRHRDLFDSAEHQQKVAAVEAVLREYFAGWAAIYQTARAGTKRRPAHTEIKFNRVILNRMHKWSSLIQQLSQLGIATDSIVFKPATESLSVHIV